MGFELVKAVIVLLVLLGGLYLLLRYLKGRIATGKGIIEMVHYQPFGPKKGVAVVKILKDYVALGVADESITLLGRLNPAEVEEALKQSEEKRTEPRAGVKGLFGGRFSGLFTVFFMAVAVGLVMMPSQALAQPAPAAPGLFGFSTPVELLFFLTVIAFLPAILVMTTCFTRIVIVLSFLRQALGTPQVPPTQVIVGLSLFVTFFVMSPVIDNIYTNAYVPYTKKEIKAEDAFAKASDPLKEFMLKQTREKDLALFLKMSKAERPAKPMDLSMRVVVPAFAIGELKRAFEIGFLIYLPFLVIDMVVASVLLSMGMMMLPPVMVSMPFKILLFVLVDGWGLLIGSLIEGFR
ncbi:MAG TPA: flagellar type III secretion system pore protein FliP [Dissulfurispiraceae bacterium]|nr:flagellar type III secretion system pore protein FliP [Dissulfurispiraceae bacterium]